MDSFVWVCVKKQQMNLPGVIGLPGTSTMTTWLGRMCEKHSGLQPTVGCWVGCFIKWWNTSYTPQSLTTGTWTSLLYKWLSGISLFWGGTFQVNYVKSSRLYRVKKIHLFNSWFPMGHTTAPRQTFMIQFGTSILIYSIQVSAYMELVSVLDNFNQFFSPNGWKNINYIEQNGKMNSFFTKSLT